MTSWSKRHSDSAIVRASASADRATSELVDAVSAGQGQHGETARDREAEPQRDAARSLTPGERQRGDEQRHQAQRRPDLAPRQGEVTPADQVLKR